MKNVRIKKDKKGRGYFLSVMDSYYYGMLAVTADELLTLLKMLKEREEELSKEVKGK